ncbi:MAG TPA: ferritin family protein [Phycisphaerae bacterium]|nr:ferritin family protein [Phycisphaerae bacterium]
MAITFNIDEIYTMAQQIERNGADFYNKAAENSADAEAARMLRELAAMEVDHEKTFTQMKAELARHERATSGYDPAGEGALYLHAMVEGKIFDFTVKPADALTGAESLPDLLQTAIGLEKDSILFYVTMKGMVPSGGGKGRIDEIIDQEVSHIATLSNKLQAIGQG